MGNNISKNMICRLLIYFLNVYAYTENDYNILIVNY